MARFARGNGLVFDLGMNNGDDTDYYLKLGHRVVALEANPALCERASARFADALAEGRLVIVNAAIWSSAGTVSFLVNLDNDHWSSIDPGWAARDDSACREISVASVTLGDLFRQHGVPAMLKIDVEGADQVVLGQLADMALLPECVSVEDCRFGFDYLRTLHACGYDGFKLQDQSRVAGCTDPHAGHIFPAGSSGPLGPFIEGDWLTYQTMIDHYAATVRDHAGRRLAPRSRWFDIHATVLA